ncbi:type IV secretion system protein VirB10 [Azospirillum picis]|uniref:Type IV secretion system protein VirB10 n=1 Tax=Azospirillum picis TaxID=488438 RepID=A0ABU0MUC0_9PROT|nr:type IV secretion system protein VirB10 [Azospirillum picis]MBP2300917.1 type IV secretion system protein VirB10 [Azospirillum picis]MDQ0537021.1 type IV secretion system protein VirB10 [Azospirillum picis]
MPGERHVSEVAGRRRGVGKATGVGVLITGSVLACGVILLTAERPDPAAEDGVLPPPRPAVRYEPPPLPPPIAQAALPLAPAVPPPEPRPAAMPVETGAAARQPRLLVYTAGVRAGPPAAAAPADGPRDGSSDPGTAGGMAGAPGDDLAARLRPTPLAGVAARVLRHQPYLLTTGTIIPCILQTAMDSSLPGLVSCLIPQDVLGKTGLTLLDRGTRVVGQFHGGVQQGVERMFVVWTRAETPQGVIVALDSPATDPLGRPGLEGAVDRHFWQRFGGALLLSTVDGAIQAGVAAAAKEGTTTINTGQTQAVIAESLRGSIAIPPTVRKNQGELVSILVARDLDFSGVYAIGPAAGRPSPLEPGR